MNRLLTVSIVLLCGLTVPAAPPATEPNGQSARRWTFLPHNIQSIYIDPKGRAWFEDSTTGLSQEDFRRLTANAFDGTTNTVSAKILLVDHTGALWIIPHDSKDLVKYDGKHWIVEHLDLHEPPPKQWGTLTPFSLECWEDASGNIFFSDDAGIFWRAPDDKWSYQPLYERNIRENLFYPLEPSPDRKYHLTARGPQSRQGHRRCLHFLAPDGSVYAWAPCGTLGIFRFDGKSWTQYDLTNGFPYENVASLLPMPDGSIGVMQVGDNTLYFWRAPGIGSKPNELSRLIAQLGDLDVVKRDAASKAILDMGRSVVPSLQAESKSTESPETKARLKTLLNAIERSPANLYGGRYEWKLEWGMPLRQGGVLLELSHLKDVTTGEEWMRPKILIRSGKPWRVVPTDLRSLTSTVYRPLYQDARGRLWIGGSRIDVADFGIAKPKQVFSDDMLAYNFVAGPDARGRMFLCSSVRQFAIFDEAAPENVGPDLAIDRWPAATTWSVPCDNGTVWAWMHDDKGPHVQVMDVGILRRFRDGKWDAPPNTPTVARLRSMIPLKNGGVLVVLQGFDGTDRSRFAAYFDGTQWRQATDLRALIVAHSDSLRALYDPDGQGTDRYESMKIDTLGNFWLTQGSVFARYDGKEWLELNNLSDKTGPNGKRLMDADELRLFNEDKRIFVQQGHTSWFLASRESDVTVIKSMSNAIIAGKANAFTVVDRRGNLWAQAFYGKDELVMLTGADATPTYFTPGGHPIYCDRENRIWSVVDGFLRVRKGDASSSLTIDGATDQSRMTQTPNGRLFLFHSKGLSEVTLSGEGEHLLLSEAGEWKDGFPIGKFPHCFFSDTHGALWLLTYSGLLRFIPPK